MELRRQGISDTEVLSALERVPREKFVPPTFRDRAYENIALPISQGQTISQPFIVAYMTQLLAVGKRSKVLEIGTGSGYQTAVLSQLCRRIYTIERYRSLLKTAEDRFREMHILNVTAKVGDGYKGWPEQAPFDNIMVTAAAENIPSNLVDQLGPGGTMVLPLGRNTEEQEIVVIHRNTDGFVSEDRLLAVRFVPMVEGVAEE
jgi:protein-L-isoaspartate(D-aspartate) O-methyltransferase